MLTGYPKRTFESSRHVFKGKAESKEQILDKAKCYWQVCKHITFSLMVHQQEARTWDVDPLADCTFQVA